jgi:hypothetical protein
MNAPDSIGERLLEQARAGHNPSSADEARVRAGLHARILADPLLMPPTSNALRGGTGKLDTAGKRLFGKALVVVAVCGAGILTLVALERKAPRPATTAISAHSSAPPTLDLATKPEVTCDAKPAVADPAEPSSRPLVAEPARAVLWHPSSAPLGSASLQQELSGLRRAQQLLHAGDPAQAVGVLDALSREIPGGVLTEDRAATRAIALCSSGHGGANLATAFLARFPGSVHSGRVRSACYPGTTN